MRTQKIFKHPSRSRCCIHRCPTTPASFRQTCWPDVPGVATTNSDAWNSSATDGANIYFKVSVTGCSIGPYGCTRAYGCKDDADRLYNADVHRPKISWHGFSLQVWKILAGMVSLKRTWSSSENGKRRIILLIPICGVAVIQSTRLKFVSIIR